jgi:hypothetical protein
MWCGISKAFFAANRVRCAVEGYGLFRQSVSLFFFLALAATAAAPDPAPADAEAYLASLIQRAEDRALHRDPYWRLLLHYRSSWRGARSLIDDPAFFLAPDGKHNPRAELQATLRAFFRPPEEHPGDHPVCRFVGRYAWLKEQLEIDPGRLPVGECEPFQQVVDFLNPVSVALVFPAAYVNSPASMFGHTLIVVDSRDKNRLLSRAISYAARTGNVIGPVFIVGSFIGVFPGYYAILPYYDRVEAYGDIDFRDMWEYELDFTPEEVRRLILHTWELQNIYSAYFFIDENCAYNLLFLLDAARPSLNLSGEFRNWVIPIDTVKAVHRKGIVRDVVYRPSKTSRMRHFAGQLSPEAVDRALAIAHGRAPPSAVMDHSVERKEQILSLDLASEYIQYLYAREKIPVATYKTMLLESLKVRSGLGKSEEEWSRVPAPGHPEKGHGPNRVAVGGGAQEGDSFLSLRFRPAYHTLADDDLGYERGAQIQFVNVEGRYYTADDDLRLQRLDIIDILSASPRDKLFKPSSWRATFGLLQNKLDDDDRQLVFQVGTGAGYTFYQPRFGLTYFMLDADVQFGGKYDSDYAAGLGPSLGWRVQLADAWSALLKAKSTYFVAGDDFLHYRASLDQNFKLAAHHSLALELSYESNDEFGAYEAGLYWNRFF